MQGTTLRVYWYVLRTGSKRPIGVREVMRAVSLSSPSVALHHLEKLREMGLLEKEPTGEYNLIGEVKVGVLQNFIGLLGVLVPRFFFYASLFTTMLILYVLLYRPDFSPHNLMALIFAVSASAVSWIEAFRAWRTRPF